MLPHVAPAAPRWGRLYRSCSTLPRCSKGPTGNDRPLLGHHSGHGDGALVLWSARVVSNVGHAGCGTSRLATYARGSWPGTVHRAPADAPHCRAASEAVIRNEAFKASPLAWSSTSSCMPKGSARACSLHLAFDVRVECGSALAMAHRRMYLPEVDCPVNRARTAQLRATSSLVFRPASCLARVVNDRDRAFDQVTRYTKALHDLAHLVRGCPRPALVKLQDVSGSMTNKSKKPSCQADAMIQATSSSLH